MNRSIVVTCIVLAAVALGWSLRRHEPTGERVAPTGEAATPVETTAVRPPPAELPRSTDNERPVDVAERESFNEQAREFFAQAPGLPLDEARQRAALISQELARIERAGGMSAGETFLMRAGLIRATEPDEQRQAEQLRALKQRYESSGQQRSVQADPMFQLYKVRESEIVAEVMSLQTIPDGLTREEYLRRRLQTAREQLLGAAL